MIENVLLFFKPPLKSIIQESIVNKLRYFSGVALMGPRKCGKTTLARQIAQNLGGKIFDLDNPEDVGGA